MCLEKLSNFKVKLDKNGVGIGWKLFHQNAWGKLLGDFQSFSVVRPRNKWLKEGDFRHESWKHAKKMHNFSGSVSYALGFHVFLTKEGAERWGNGCYDPKITMIKFRKPVAKGLQLEHRCVVAKEIFIPKEA